MHRVTQWGVQWLASAADDPGRCRAVWRDRPHMPYLLPTGRLFDVVVVDQRVGLETFDQMARRQLPLGPVMVDRSAGRLGFLLPRLSRELFTRVVEEDTESPLSYRYLGQDSYVVVPPPLTTSRDRYAWLRPPTKRLAEEAPACTRALAAVLMASAALVRRADQYGEEAEAVPLAPIEPLLPHLPSRRARLGGRLRPTGSAVDEPAQEVTAQEVTGASR